jgi:hypothetical protein
MLIVLKIWCKYLKLFSPYRAVNTLPLSYRRNELIQYREINAVCSGTHTKHINAICGQKVKHSDVEPGRTIVSKGLKSRSITNHL